MRQKNKEEMVLMIDIDWMPKPWLKFYEKTRRLLLEALGYEVTKFIAHPSPGGRGIHVWIHIKGKPLTEMELLKFQYIVGGDDPIRSKINYRRVRRGIKGFWNKLFSIKHRLKSLPKRCRKCRIRRAVMEWESKEEIWDEEKAKF